MPSSIHTRLHRMMRDLDLTQADIARASGAAKQTVSDWMNDGQIQMDAVFAFNLQDAYGYSAKWLLLGKGPIHAVDFAKEIIHHHESGRSD